jgi:membrane protease subunit (stomatin/prohibitin family)
MNMSHYGKIIKSATLGILGAIAFATSIPAQADGAGAFIGGIAVARIGQNARDRRDYEEDQAYYAQQQANAAQQQANAAQQQQPSAESQIRKLDNLLAQGLITKDEYNTQKQKILDSL